MNLGRTASPWSAAAAATTKPAPAAPPAPVVSAALARKVTLTWPANGEADVAEYAVEYRDGDAGRFRECGRVKAGAGTPSFEHAGRPDAWSGAYRVKAIDRDTLEGAWSPEAPAATKPRPDPPTGLRAEWNGGSAAVSWTPPKQRDIVAYRVYQKGFLGRKLLWEGPLAPARLAADAVGKGVTILVTAVDRDGLESDAVLPLEVRPPAAGAP